ncbi:MAG: ABC transporter permease [Deltaproteobacteria bacterium]|nr:ABC transporter permease [Deltaproteobacteria bacterium]MBW1921096.1 ABC transporter permease [Deltaproteobacteria bacterium]MBW1934543.1 ABC transporter permease [Deltaproteobacteria bacterium]MBW1977013.1 ABC transporter permease [Deltaproteobacteria bacterium]MBW2044064.1 ABC transporter permease [Deltaproteobacteria bacterium]
MRKDSRLRRNWAKLRRNKAALFGGALLLIYLVTAVLAPVLFPGNPSAPNLAKSLERPSFDNPLGTDELGRSILGRIIYGSRVSLLIAVGVVSVGLLVGVPLGLISGYYGGKVDFGIQRVTDMMLAFPGFLLALALVAVLGVGLKNTVISIGISMVPIYIRLVRGCVLSVREEVYVEAARAVGTRDPGILMRHILPNVMVPITVQTSLGMGTAILFAAGLGFLGVGVQPPTPEWGAMLGSGRVYLFNSPHVATFPGVAIFLSVLSFNLLGDGLRDALDPRFKL